MVGSIINGWVDGSGKKTGKKKQNGGGQKMNLGVGRRREIWSGVQTWGQKKKGNEKRKKGIKLRLLWLTGRGGKR